MSLLAQIFSVFLYLFLSYLSLFLSRFHFRPVSSLSSFSPTGICFSRLDPLLRWLRFPLLARTLSIPLLFHTSNVAMSEYYKKKYTSPYWLSYIYKKCIILQWLTKIFAPLLVNVLWGKKARSKNLRGKEIVLLPWRLGLSISVEQT